jgi:hypothetical protein
MKTEWLILNVLFIILFCGIVRTSATDLASKTESKNIHNFTVNLLGMMSEASWASQIIDKNQAENEIINQMANVEEANTHFTLASIIIQKHLNDKNKLFKEIAKTSIQGLSTIILVNNKMQDLTRKYLNGDLKEGDLLAQMSKLYGTRKTMIRNLAILGTHVITSFTKYREDKTGKLDYLLTFEDRKNLIDEIESKYKHELDEVIEMEQGMRNEMSIFSMAINHIYKNLQYETYEDAKNKHFRPLISESSITH